TRLRSTPKGKLDIRLRHRLLELEPSQQPVLGPGDLPSLGKIGNLPLRLLEHLLGFEARRRQDACEGRRVDIVVLCRLARTRGECDDHAVELAFGYETLCGILYPFGERDIPAGIDDDKAGLGRHTL